jgi:membrane fusion protein (multidrug efflux system)
VEILSGLKTGDQVVVEGSDRLADGIDVQTGPPAGAGAPGGGAGSTPAAAGAQR